ncbi:MAG: M6 family metalloprotease domain-containing protein, partial [Candidatus Cryptobacteroides sp.]
EFSDVYFQSENDLQAFEDLLTLNGYSKNGATGSALDYFNDQFKGFFEFDFDVAGPIRLSKKRSYYGGNDSDGYDEHPEEMIDEACRLAYGSGVDFSLYDNDNDGFVDNVFVFFAGEDEADLYSDEECIWSHAWYLYRGAGINAEYNGKKIDSYACTSELTWISETKKVLAGIGTFCHEYSHTFGLPDFYDTDYGGSLATDDDPYISMAAGLWIFTALMDGGNQNNNSNTPPYYNCIEREYLGMSEPEILTAGEHTLEPVHLNGKCYRIDTEDPDEYFLLECRSNSGWDKYINERSTTNFNKCRGLLLYHIDKSKSRSYPSEEHEKNLTPYERWEVYNELNANPDHQCADLIEADGRADKLPNMNYLISQIKDLSGMYYPNGGTAIPNAVLTSWNGKETGYSITDITMDGDNVRFKVSIGASAINMAADTFQNEAIISWGSTDPSISEEASVTLSGPGKNEAFKVTPYEEGKYAITLTGLTPSSKYTLTVKLSDEETALSQEMSFTTAAMAKDYAYPYIYLTSVKQKNMNGTFQEGAKLPLKLFNAGKAEGITWTFDGKEIAVGADGYYTLNSSGILRAVADYGDGTTDIIERELIVK